MEKVFLNEILRIQELMGKKLISESTLGFIDEIMEFIAKKTGMFGGVVDDLIEKLAKVSSEDEALSIIARIANTSDELSSYIVPKIMSTLTDLEKQEIQSIKDYLETHIKNKTINIDRAKRLADEWTHQKVRTPFDGVKKVISKDLTDFIDNAARKVDDIPDVPLPNPPKPIDPLWKPYDEANSLSPDEIVDLTKLNTGFWRNFRRFYQTFLDQFTGEEKLIDEVIDLTKTLETAGPSQTADILDRMSNLFITLAQKRKNIQNQIKDFLEKEIPDKGPTKGIRFKLEKLPGYEFANAMLRGQQKKEWITKYGGFSKRMSELRRNLVGFMNPVKWRSGFGPLPIRFTGKGYDEYIKRWKEILKDSKWQKFRTDYIAGTTLTTKQWDEYIRTFGVPNAIIQLGKEYVYSYIIFSAAFAIIDFTTDVLGHYLVQVYPENWIGHGTLLANAESYDKHFNGVVPEKDAGTFQKSWELIQPYWKYLLDELKEGKGIPGGLDDTYRIIVSLSHTFAFTPPITAEDKQKAADRLREGAERVGEGLDSLQNRSHEILENAKTKWEKMESSIKASSLGFLGWIAKNNFVNKDNPSLQLKVKGREYVKKDWWTSEEDSENGAAFGTTEGDKNWVYSPTNDEYIPCSDCVKKENNISAQFTNDLKGFSEYLISINVPVGKNDEPYMEQNPQDATEWQFTDADNKVFKYKYNGNTFLPK